MKTKFPSTRVRRYRYVYSKGNTSTDRWGFTKKQKYFGKRQKRKRRVIDNAINHNKYISSLDL